MSATRSKPFAWAHLGSPELETARMELQTAKRQSQAMQTRLCSALREWCGERDPTLRASARKWAGREIKRAKLVRREYRRAIETMTALDSAMSEVG